MKYFFILFIGAALLCNFKPDIKIKRLFNMQYLFSSFQLLILIFYGGLRVNFFEKMISLKQKRNACCFCIVVELRLPSMNLPWLY